MDNINEKYGRHLTISHKGTEEQNEQAYDTKQHWHVVVVVAIKDGETGVKVLPIVVPAVLKLTQGKIGVKVLPRVLPTILKYYNEILKLQEIQSVELYMSKDSYFDKYPNSGIIIYHYDDGHVVMKHLQDAEHMKCDGTKVKRDSRK